MCATFSIEKTPSPSQVRQPSYSPVTEVSSKSIRFKFCSACSNDLWIEKEVKDSLPPCSVTQQEQDEKSYSWKGKRRYRTGQFLDLGRTNPAKQASWKTTSQGHGEIVFCFCFLVESALQGHIPLFNCTLCSDIWNVPLFILYYFQWPHTTWVMSRMPYLGISWFGQSFSCWWNSCTLGFFYATFSLIHTHALLYVTYIHTHFCCCPIILALFKIFIFSFVWL